MFFPVFLYLKKIVQISSSAAVCALNTNSLVSPQPCIYYKKHLARDHKNSFKIHLLSNKADVPLAMQL